MEQMYMDEKWKLSKKGSRNNGSRRVYTGDASTSNAASTSGTTFFRRSESAREPRSNNCTDSSDKSSSRSLSGRCAGLVKEQRARFYIVRRCVTMLVCWKDA